MNSEASRKEYDALALTTMASGHLCMNLSERISWESFPAFADAVLKRIGGTKVGAAEAVDIRIWHVVIDGHQMQLVFDDFPGMVSLESPDSQGDDVLRRVYAHLKEDDRVHA